RLQLLGQGPARGHRSRPGGGGHLEAPLRRVHRMADLDLRSRVLPHRFPEPRDGPAPVGVVVPHVQPWGAADHRRGPSAKRRTGDGSMPCSITMSLAAEVKARAAELGFLACGITDPSPPPHADRLDAWLARGYAG